MLLTILVIAYGLSLSVVVCATIHVLNGSKQPPELTHNEFLLYIFLPYVLYWIVVDPSHLRSKRG